MNTVFLSGNLTRAVELKMTPSGIPVANVGLAINERWVDQETGEQRENVCFVELEAWNRTAKSLFEYFRKGDPILVSGSLKFESWTTEDGQNRSRLKVRVQRWEFMRQRTDTESVTVEQPPVTDTPSDEQPPF